MIIDSNISDHLRLFINKNSYSSIFVLCDENTKSACLPILQSVVDEYHVNRLVVPAGESTKNTDTCISIWEHLNKFGADRHSLLINLGGGMITDLGGFVASTFKRGIDFVHIPTSMLAMIDASLGGKNGINLGNLKNQVGVIREPQQISINPEFLQTLSRRDYLSGYAEALKHALLSGAEEMERTIEQASPDFTGQSFPDFLKMNIGIKERIVAVDPYEKFERKALNFGHTIGHAIESYTHETKEPLLHGEAVAWGMLAELYISQKMFSFPARVLEEMERIIKPLYKVPGITNNYIENILELMKFDKKNFDQQVRFALLEKPGVYKVDQVPEINIIKDSIHYLQSLWQ